MSKQYCEIGLIISESIIKLNEYGDVTMYAALHVPTWYKDTEENIDHTCWILMWEAGGDYNCFLDDKRNDENDLEEWMIEAIKDSTAFMRNLFKDKDNVYVDMEWFDEYAEDIKNTLSK